MRWSVLVTSILAARCVADPPPLANPTMPQAMPPLPAVVAPVTTAPAAAPTAPELDALLPLEVNGPEAALDDLCGPSCRIARKLPLVSPMKQVVIAVGSDPRSEQPTSVKSTHVAFELEDGWYGAVLFREGEGVEHVEIFNPPDFNGGAPARAFWPARYAGELRYARVIQTRDGQRLVAIELRRTERIALNALVLCGASPAGAPVCSELVTGEETTVRDYSVGGGLIDVTFSGGEREKMVVFP